MPQLFAEAGRRKFVSPFTRLRAWWMGLDDAELLSRYGESGLCRAMWVRWRGTIVAVACASVMFINMSQSNRANEILDNIELNRRRYYKRDFVPEYVSNAPEAVYDGPKGYSYRDEVSGIMINADGRLTSDLSREERRAQLDGAQISSGMLEAAQAAIYSDQLSAPVHMQRVPGEGTSTRKYFRKTLCSSASGSGLNNLDAPRTPVGHRLRNEEVPTFCDPELKEKMGMRSGTMSMGHFFANEVFGESDNTSDMNSFRIDVPCTPTVGVRRWHHQGRNDKLRVRIAGRKPIEEGILDGHEDTDEPSSSSSSASRGTETDGTSGDSSPDEDGGNDNIWGNVGKGKDDGDDGYDDDESATQPDSEDGKFTPRPRRWVPGKTCSDHSKSDPSMAQRYRYLSVEERVRIIKEERDRRLEGVRQKFVAMRANVVAPRPHTLVRVRMGGYKAIGFYGNRKTYENCALLAITANPAPLSRGITPERRSDRSNEKENKESPPRAVLSPAPRRPDSFDIKHSFREQKREQFGFKFIGENSRGSSASVLSIDKDD